MDIVKGIISCLAAVAILTIGGYFWGKIILMKVLYFEYDRENRRNLRQLRREVRKYAPGVRAIMSRIALTTMIHLRKGEELTLDEYGEILEGSLSRSLRECIYIARTKPSQWYCLTTTPEKPEKREDETEEDFNDKIIEYERTLRRVDLERRIKEYFDKQKELKKQLQGKIIIRRYIVLSQPDWDGDPYIEKFIDDHNNSEIELYHCAGVINGVVEPDMAIFVDRHRKKWSVEGLNFTETTIEGYLNGVGTPIRARVEVQPLLDTEYTDRLRQLHRNAIAVVDKGNTFYFQRKGEIEQRRVRR